MSLIKTIKKDGQSSPLGSTMMRGGVNFSLFCKKGMGVDLLLFDNLESDEPDRIISLDPLRNRTYHYWHVFVPGVSAGQLYGYRIHGKYEPSEGLRYDSEKVLLDPYSKIVAVPKGYNRTETSLYGKSKTPSMKSIVTDMRNYNWDEDQQPRRPFAETIIYELHIGGFTKHPNSGVAEEKRGTFSGLIEKIPYLVELGITAVELLPVYQFDPFDAPNGSINYWGYSPISFFAPHQGYSSDSSPTHVLNEFRDMVKALHRAGIEVILDVVYNHTTEGNENGPTLCYRGIDNSVYYILEQDKTYYANYSGTGNTLNANQTIVRRMIIDSLHFWVKDMHVDGFRFDLASILSRDESGKESKNPPILWDIESDPILVGTKLIAEAWDAAGLYQVGSFIGDSWQEWNGKFRDDIRSFLRGDQGTVKLLATRLFGSPDIYGDQGRGPEQSVNFVTCHDGFTLNDLVSYNYKHNEANREDNRDGSNDNQSWNCGVEGESQDAAVENLRNRQIKNFFTLTLLSLGTPMLSMGDEVRRTQYGNNNAYCQDNELSWFNWDLLERNQGLHRFVKLFIKIREQNDSTKEEYSKSLNEILSDAEIQWHGVKLHEPDWSNHSHTIALTWHSFSSKIAMHVMINSYSDALEFELPNIHNVGGRAWKRVVDTSLESPDDISLIEDAPEIRANSYIVNAHSVVILIVKMK